MGTVRSIVRTVAGHGNNTFALVRINFGAPGDRLGAKLDAMRFIRIAKSRKEKAARLRLKELGVPPIPEGMAHVGRYSKENPNSFSRDALSAACLRGVFRSARKLRFIPDGGNRVYKGWFVDKDELDTYCALPDSERRYIGMLLRRGGTSDEVWDYIEAYKSGFRRERTKG